MTWICDPISLSQFIAGADAARLGVCFSDAWPEAMRDGWCHAAASLSWGDRVEENANAGKPSNVVIFPIHATKKQRSIRA